MNLPDLELVKAILDLCGIQHVTVDGSDSRSIHLFVGEHHMVFTSRGMFRSARIRTPLAG